MYYIFSTIRGLKLWAVVVNAIEQDAFSSKAFILNSLRQLETVKEGACLEFIVHFVWREDDCSQCLLLRHVERHRFLFDHRI